MKLCQRDTFLYWCVHFFIWIVITLPTVIFVLRVSHPNHEPSAKLNVTDEENDTTSYQHEDCLSYTEANCQMLFTVNNTGDNALGYHDEIKEILSGVFLNYPECTNNLKQMLTIKSCIKCTNKTLPWGTRDYLGNISNEICKKCPKTQLNALPVGGKYQWLENVTCFHELFKENYVKNRTEENATCFDPLVKDENGTCRIPCDWTLMSDTVRDTYYGAMVLNLWAALIAAVITIGTLASFKLMRTFPHIVRFYIIISSILYATISLLPLRVGLAKVYCGNERFWDEKGHTSKLTVLEGAITHYFFLAFCFWSCCYVINTYSVIVKDTHNVFLQKNKYHVIQFVLCTTLPALLVAINMAIKPPGYKSLFLDRMTSVFTSPILEYMTSTFPIQLTLGIAISLLWSMIRFVRKVRKNKSTLQAIRPDDDCKAFINAEKQFTKLALLFVITVAVVLSSEVVITYQNEQYIHQVEEYFQCKQISPDCSKPETKIFFLSSVKVSGPGLFCLLNFFLLFFNKDTRDVWKKWLTWISHKLTVTRRKRNYSSNDSATAVKSGNGVTRSRSGTTETISSVNSLKLLSKYEISQGYIKPANMTEIQMTSQFTGAMETDDYTAEFSPPLDGEYLTPPAFLTTLSDTYSSEKDV